jgi:hypothetical protein
VARNAHKAFVEFEVKSYVEVLPEWERRFREEHSGRPQEHTVTHYQRLRMTAREQDVDTLVARMTSTPGTYLSELSCAAGCPACQCGHASPF